MLVVALLLSAAFVCLFMFRLSEAEVTGNYHVSKEEVTALVNRGPFKDNTLFLSLFFNDRKVRGGSFIDKVDVTYVRHDAVSIRVYEKNLVGYVKYKNSYWYFDREGRVLVESLYKESEYKALARGEKLPWVLEDAGTAESKAAGPDADSTVALNAADGEKQLAVVREPSVYLTDDGEYIEPETEEYEYSENEEHSEDENEYSENEEYSEDENEYSENNDEVILIEPELIEEAAPTPIPPEEYPPVQGTPIPPQEEYVKEYKSEDTFAENYIPEITGLRFTEAVVGEKLPVRYSLIYAALDALKTFAETYGIFPTSVDISGTGDLQIHFNDVTVNLGTGEHIERRLAVLRQILDELLGRSGTMHLENYDGTESRLIFSKSEKNS